MRESVLLSIKPQFANAILEGKKRFEYRRGLFRRKDVQRVSIYASAPEKKVIGEFLIEDVLSLEPGDLWAKTRRYAGIDKSYFDEYFAGKCQAYAIKVRNPHRYPKPLDLKVAFGMNRPPQSFCYV